MGIFRGRYVISRGETDIWAQQGNAGIDVIGGSVNDPEDGTLVFTIKPDQLFRLDSWAHPEGLVVGFTGVLARQIKDLSSTNIITKIHKCDEITIHICQFSTKVS